MPMGVVSDNDFEAELNNCLPKSKESVNESAPEITESQVETVTPEVLDEFNAVIADKPHRGRSEGDNNVPNSLRKIIGATNEIEGREEALALARMFDVSASSVSAYANGATSTSSYNKPKVDITEFISSRKNRITKKALRKITVALDNITDDALEGLPAKDLTAIAKDMSSVVKHMEPQISGPSQGGPQFVIYAPKMIQENYFETVQVNE